MMKLAATILVAVLGLGVSGAPCSVAQPRAQIAFVSDFAASGMKHDAEIYVTDANGDRVRALTRNRVDDFDPAWSPDGRSLAFVRGGGVWTVRLDGGGQRRLVAHAAVPAWNPDERTISFTRGGSTYVVQSDGSHVRLLLRNARFAQWSPDGGTIAFVRSDELWLENADGSDPRQITHVGDVIIDGCYLAVEGPAAWSPEGTELAVTVSGGCSIPGGNPTSFGSIGIVTRDGDIRTGVGGPGDIDELGSFDADWSPDGTLLVYTRIAHAGAELHVVGADGSNDHQLFTHPPRGASPSFLGAQTGLAAWQPLRR